MHGKDGKKQNRSHNGSRPKLLCTSAFEFRSPYTVDECVTRLKAFQEKQSEVKVHEIVDNGAVVDFSLSLSLWRTTAWLNGMIEHRENEPTLVRGFTGTERFTVILFALLPIFFILASLGTSPFNLETLIVTALIVVFATGMQVLFTNLVKAELKEMLQNVCGKPESF